METGGIWRRYTSGLPNNNTNSKQHKFYTTVQELQRDITELEAALRNANNYIGIFESLKFQKKLLRARGWCGTGHEY